MKIIQFVIPHINANVSIIFNLTTCHGEFRTFCYVVRGIFFTIITGEERYTNFVSRNCSAAHLKASDAAPRTIIVGACHMHTASAAADLAAGHFESAALAPHTDVTNSGGVIFDHTARHVEGGTSNDFYAIVRIAANLAAVHIKDCI